MSEQQVYPTGLRVFDGEDEHEVVLIESWFSIVNDDGTVTRRESFTELQQLCQSKAERIAKRERESRRSSPVEITVIASDFRDEDAQIHDGQITGLSVDGGRVLTKGLPSGVRIGTRDKVYRRFTSKDRDEFIGLLRAIKQAREGHRKFLEARLLGDGKDVGQQAEQGVPITA